MPSRQTGVDDLGQSGYDIIDDALLHTPENFNHWFAIRALEADITITTATAEPTIGGDGMDGITLTKDVVYVGLFTAIQIPSGKIQCFRSNT